jgi:dihydrofolate reductase
LQEVLLGQRFYSEQITQKWDLEPGVWVLGGSSFFTQFMRSQLAELITMEIGKQCVAL